MELKARTKLACQTAGLDPARFNEAVHFNKFVCAPPTVPGSARVFQQDDIVALFIYKQLMDFGMSSERAGCLACEAHSKFKDQPEVDVVSYLRDRSGIEAVITGEVQAGASYGGFNLMGLWASFNIKDIRSYVRKRLEGERSIVGEE